MGSENSKQSNLSSQLFATNNDIKIKKTVTIVSEPITFEDSGYFDTFQDSGGKKNLEELESTKSQVKNSNEEVKNSTNNPVLKSILKPSKYPPIINQSILEQNGIDKENLESNEIGQTFSSKNSITVFANSEPIIIKKAEPLFMKNSEAVFIRKDEQLVLPIRKVISNPNLPIARPIIISQQAIPQATIDWLDTQTKIIPIRKKISPQKILTQELTSQSESNEWKKYFRNNKLEEVKKTSTKNFGFQNQSEEFYLLSKKVKNLDASKRSSSLPMLPVIQSNVPKALISNRSTQLKLNDANKRKKLL